MSLTYDRQRSHYQQQYLCINSAGRAGREEEIRTSPLFSLAVKHTVDPVLQVPLASDGSTETFPTDTQQAGSVSRTPVPELDDNPSCEGSTECLPKITGPVLPQYGLLGFNVDASDKIADNEPIMMNVDAPNSIFICGSQGSGKSYTLSAMLENCLLNDSTVGAIDQPVAGVVFHYDVDSSSSVAEVAHLCSSGIEVNVLVSQSNERALRVAYEQVGSHGNKPKVRPLLLRSSDLSIDRMNKLMALSEKEGPAPLYMEVVQRILRQMAIQGITSFDYKHFRRLLDGERLTKDQMSPMNLRFSLLESFMHPDDLPAGTNTWRPSINSDHSGSLFSLKPGSLTIVDLSDTFIDSSTVCILFDICLSLVKLHRPSSGLVIALDEAHKFMNTSTSASNFTNGLLTTIREQRHNATRVIIATQEPTISEKLLDLCSISIVHRFTSPAWFEAIRGHLGGASKMLLSGEEGCEMFERILDLDVGESLVFCPAAFVSVGKEDGKAKKLGANAMKMKTRNRLGTDGGMSMLASRTQKVVL